MNVVRRYSPKPLGTVLSQSVSAGTDVRAGRTIRLVISKVDPGGGLRHNSTERQGWSK